MSYLASPISHVYVNVIFFLLSNFQLTLAFENVYKDICSLFFK
jgi:hypothetical protein